MTRFARITKGSNPPITGKCDICEEMTYLPFRCKKCLGIFCDKHHLPENHSCIPISKIIQEIKQFEEQTLPKNVEEEIKNNICEKKRIIVRLQSMYENGEMGRSEYLDKINSYNREKDDLEAKLNQLQNIGANSKKETHVDNSVQLLMELQNDKIYNENLGKTYTSTISPKDGLKAFPELINELDELKRSVRFAEMDMISGIGDKKTVELQISIWKKRIIILENENKLEPSLLNEVKNYNSPPKVEEKYKKELIPKSSSTWKKIDFSGRTPYRPPNEVLKPKKSWWKFW
jgi:hypothetical protein